MVPSAVHEKNIIPALQWYDVVCIAKWARVCYHFLAEPICWLESCCASEARYEHYRFGKTMLNKGVNFIHATAMGIFPYTYTHTYSYVPLVTLVSFVQKFNV